MASIKKMANGNFWARVCLGRDERTGKQIWLTRTFRPVEGLTPAKAEREVRQRVYEWETQARADHEAGLDQRRDKVRLADFIRGSWQTYSEGRGLAYNTRIGLKKSSAILLEYFGERIRLVEINRERIDGFIGWLRNERGYSDKTVRVHFDCLRGILDYATEAGYLKENPIDRMKPKDRPQVKNKEPDFLSEDEARDFLDALDNDKFLSELWKCYFSLLLFAGVRRAEGLALQWQDYDPEKKELTISKSVTLTGEAGAVTAIKLPKNNKTRRVPVADSLAAALESRRRECVEHYGECRDEWYIFGRTSDPAKVRNPNDVYVRLTRFQKRNGLRQTSVHLLRHTFASLALANGADIASIQKVLGHSRPSMTLAYYSGVSEKQQRTAVDALEKAIKK